MKNPIKEPARLGSSATATWFETGAVVLLICAPTLSWLLCSLLWGSEYQKLIQQRRDADYETAMAFETALVQSMVSQIRLVPIVLFLMWRTAKGWPCFGLVKPRFWKDVLLGVGLWLVLATFDRLIRPYSAHHPWFEYYPVAVPWHRAIWLLGDCCAIGFSEELAFRAYLIPRLEGVTGATWKAVLLSVMLFGFAHLSKGYLGFVYAVVGAIIWSIGFCLTRRVWPVAVSHAIADFIILTHISSHVGLW